ncbi:MAG: hypothetical protein KatS3mg090_0963 [Patescibacteria group bacterium]|nr:MAG: hypothetical protein KatS3mg090_0963 [Patescibacteria group bacterium]
MVEESQASQDEKRVDGGNDIGNESESILTGESALDKVDKALLLIREAMKVGIERVSQVAEDAKNKVKDVGKGVLGSLTKGASHEFLEGIKSTDHGEVGPAVGPAIGVGFKAGQEDLVNDKEAPAVVSAVAKEAAKVVRNHGDDAIAGLAKWVGTDYPGVGTLFSNLRKKFEGLWVDKWWGGLARMSLAGIISLGAPIVAWIGGSIFSLLPDKDAMGNKNPGQIAQGVAENLKKIISGLVMSNDKSKDFESTD